MPKLSTELIADYLDINNEDGLDYIDCLRSQIKDATSKAREYFSLGNSH